MSPAFALEVPAAAKLDLSFEVAAESAAIGFAEMRTLLIRLAIASGLAVEEVAEVEVAGGGNAQRTIPVLVSTANWSIIGEMRAVAGRLEPGQPVLCIKC